MSSFYLLWIFMFSAQSDLQWCSLIQYLLQHTCHLAKLSFGQKCQKIIDVPQKICQWDGALIHPHNLQNMHASLVCNSWSLISIKQHISSQFQFASDLELDNIITDIEYCSPGYRMLNMVIGNADLEEN